MKRLRTMTSVIFFLGVWSLIEVVVMAPVQAATVTDTFQVSITDKRWCQGNPKFVESITTKISLKDPSTNTILTIKRDPQNTADLTQVQVTIDTKGRSADLDAMTLTGTASLSNKLGNKAELVLTGVNPGNTNHFITIRGQVTLDRFGNLIKITGSLMFRDTNTYTTDRKTGAQSGPVECFNSGTFATNQKRATGSGGGPTYIKASNTEAFDFFGSSLALSGDTLAVGVPSEASCGGIGGNQSNNGCPDAGAVYIFTRTAGVWSQQAYIKASIPEAFDHFGSSLALSGDTLAVGAPEEDSCATGIDTGFGGSNQANNGCNSAGAVYIFTRIAGAWLPQAYVKASNTKAVTSFGESVALSGDTLAVGSPGERSCATGIDGDQVDTNCGTSGAVYVFTRTAGVWNEQQAYIKASNTGIGDSFGFRVALSGNTLAVAAPSEDSCATGIGGDEADSSCDGAGAVYVFTRVEEDWSQQAYVKASNTDSGDDFGISMALNGDTLAVGSRDESSCARGINGNQADNNCFAAGAVYVFTRTAGNWSQQAYVKASNAETFDFFSQSPGTPDNGVALSGNTLAVGARDESSCSTGIGGDQTDNTCGKSGAVYVFTRTAGNWSQQAYVKASNTEGNDHFGVSVALSGDTLAVGANLESSCATGIGGNQTDNACFEAGAVYVYQGVQ